MKELDSHSRSGQGYLLGFRGFLVIQYFLWVFLQTFVPVAVKDSANSLGSTYERVLRQALSVLIWNDSSIYSSLNLLSARTICIPYPAVASAVFRRGPRLWSPRAVALAIVKILSTTIGTSHVNPYIHETGNVSFGAPSEIPNGLVYLSFVLTSFGRTTNSSNK